jgi:hypothetical protein
LKDIAGQAIEFGAKKSWNVDIEKEGWKLDLCSMLRPAKSSYICPIAPFETAQNSFIRWNAGHENRCSSLFGANKLSHRSYRRSFGVLRKGAGKHVILGRAFWY